ncbi:uncharacterized protein VP01_3967g1, partial [Puccinia sorghi]
APRHAISRPPWHSASPSCPPCSALRKDSSAATAETRSYPLAYISSTSSIQKTLTIMFSTFEKCLNVIDITVLLSLLTISAWTWLNDKIQNTSLLQKDTPFLFTEQASKEFDALKESFTTAPILAHFSELAQTLIETDASDYAVAGVISQSGVHTFSVFQNLSHSYSPTGSMGRISFVISFYYYLLTRKISSEGKAFTNKNPDNIFEACQGLKLVWLVDWAIGTGGFELVGVLELSTKIPAVVNITSYLKEYSISKNDLLLYKEKIVVPDNPSLKLSILESRHYSPLAGHFGQEKTYRLISRDFSWPGMTRDLKDNVKSCYDCNHNKSSKHRKYDLLQPLPILPLPWHSFSMDFISQLPLSNGYDAILFITTCTSLQLADLNFELTLKQKDNATRNKPINFTFNLPLSTLTNPKTFRKEAWSIQNQISCFEKRFQTFSSFKMEGNPPSFSCLVISLTKIKLPGNPPTIFETLLTWFKTFIPPTLTNLFNLKSSSLIS